MNAIPIAQVEAGEQVRYLHSDHLNTPRLATNASGVKIWSWEGEAFGNTQPTGTVTVNLRFPGQYYDAESGLHYNWNRYYDPKLGRYVTSDPIGIAGGLNTYSYVDNNPLRYVDPLGLSSELIPDPANMPESEQEIRDALDMIPDMIPGGAAIKGSQAIFICMAKDFRKKPGSLGKFKSTDALRRENRMARDVAGAENLNRDQMKRLHDEISGQNLTYEQIREIARQIAKGKL